MSDDFPRPEEPYSANDSSSERITPTAAATPSPAVIRSGGRLLLLLMVLSAAAAYAFHEHLLAKQLAAQNGEITATLRSTRSQIDSLAARLSEMSAAESLKPPAAASSAQPVRSVKRASARHRSADDARWKRVQAQLSEQNKQIDATRLDLSNTRTELQGSIARTHDELVLLEKKGERSYFEFDIDKNGQFQPHGSVGIRLKKASTKREYADLELMVGDYKVSKKHVNIYEPVVFYSTESQQPVELVINTITKNHIHGYVSEPKYRSSDLQAMAGTGANSGSSGAPPAPPSQQRQKLEAPK